MRPGGRRIAGERGQRGRTGGEVAERNVEWMEQMVARAKGKQNSTHDSHVVTAAPERRKKIGLCLLHFGRLPLPSLFYSFIRKRVSTRDRRNSTERADARRELGDTIWIGRGEVGIAFNELLVISGSLLLADE